MAKRGDALELAVLGLLHESPLHGYELRKRLTGVLGWGRVLSYGSLYPCLKQLLRDGLIAEDVPDPAAATRAPAGAARSSTSSPPRARSGSPRWCRRPARARGTTTTSASTSPSSARPTPRPGCASSKAAAAASRSASTACAPPLARSRERVDSYTLELQRHGLESVEREVRWLTELIDNERVGQRPPAAAVEQHRRR